MILVVQLESGQRIAQLDDRSEQPIIHILTSDRRETTFYLGFVAEFALPPAQIRRHCLRHASLSVFYDIMGEPIPLFRAEWDQLDAANLASKHAQPHWHFVQRPERIETLVRTRLARSAADVVDFIPGDAGSGLFSGVIDCGKLHFAMMSLNDKTPIKQDFDTDDFSKWFERMTRYVADQISYLVSRMPSAATPAARVFQPGTE